MQDTNLNLQPYFDDYDRTKGYYKVLFKPGTSIQSRELTTLQSILQNQIERFGQHTFKEGSVVIPGQIGYNLFYNAVLVQQYISGSDLNLTRTSLVGKKIRGLQSNVVAEVLSTIGSEESEKGLVTLYVKYVSSGNDVEDNGGQPGISQYTKFINNEVLVDENNNQVALTYSQNASDYIGSSAYITSGVYFIRGFFVEVPEQSIILEQYNDKPSYKIGLDIVESIVTAEDDSSLYDNSIGSTNYAAPGADRLKIEAVLVKKDLSFSDTSSFIELLRLESGNSIQLTKLVENSFYNELEKNLARRTFDESGNYALQAFDVKIKETFDDGNNNGIYKFNEILPDGRKVLNYSPTAQDGEAINGEDYYTAVVSPGKAYVKGFEINVQNKAYITVDKPRQVSESNNSGTESVIGSYFELDKTSIKGSVNKNTVVNFNRVVSGVTTVVGKARAAALNTSFSIPRIHVVDFTLYTNITCPNVGTDVVAGNFLLFNNGVEGIVESISNGTSIILRNVTGTIYPGTTFVSTKNKTTSYTVSTVEAYKISDIDTITATNFTSVPRLEDFKITGTDFYLNNNIVTGNSTNFLEEVRPGMKLVLGSTSVVVSAVNSTQITLVNSNGLVNGTYVVKKSVAVYKQDSRNLFLKVLDTPVKTIDDVSYYKTITETKPVESGSNVYISPPTNYVISSSDILVTPLFGSNNSGVIPYTATTNSTGLTINLGTTTESQVSVTYKVKVSNPELKTKTYIPYRFLKVTDTSLTSPYGTRIFDDAISLKYTDVNEIHAIHEAASNDVTDFTTLFDKIVVNNSTGIVAGDIIVANNIRSRVISKNNNTLYVKYLSTTKISAGSNLAIAADIITNYNIKGVVITSSVHGVYNDITSTFTLVRNDDADFYNISKLIKNKNAASPQNKFVVVFGFFQHQNTTNDFYTVDSYNLEQIRYDTVPITYTKVPTSEIIDFRHDTSVTVGSSTGSISSPDVETICSLDPYNVTRIIGNTPQPNQVIDYDYTYYLGRIDKLYLNENGGIDVVKGTDSLNPAPPQVNNSNMLLATVYLPPYLKSVANASITLEPNPRYTMKDISKLENRIETVENMTSLNLLEVNTNTLNVLDEDGNNRFKTGFVVDNFKSISFADVNNPNFTASLDTTAALVRPLPYTNNIDLEYSTSLSNAKLHTKAATIPYEEVRYAAQEYASRVENLQPFEIANWIGEITLTPERDIWYDTIRSQNETQTLDLATPLKALFDMSGGEGYNWEEWQTTSVNYNYYYNWWYGYYGYYPYYYYGYYPYSYPYYYGYYGYYGYNWWYWGRWRGYYWRYWGWYGYYPYYYGTATQERSGTYNTFNETQQNIELGDTFNGMTSVKLARSRIIQLDADRLKPNTNFNFLVDDKEQNGIIYPKDITDLTDRSGTFIVGETVHLISIVSDQAPYLFDAPANTEDEIILTELPINNQLKAEVITSPLGVYTSSSTYISLDKINTIEEDGLNPDYLEYKFKIVGQTSGATATVTLSETGTRVKSDEYGILRAFVLIPPVSFETGDLKFTLDNTLQTNIEGISDSSAEAIYYSQGTDVDVSSNTLAVKSADITSTPVTQERTISINPWYWCPNWDPLAQSFFVTEEGGIFVTSLELFFQSKDSVEPVSIEIRIMENGNITDKVVDNSSTSLPASSINISDDATVPTKFTFKDPIYLNQGSEYAFIVRSTSKQYKVWISRLSENDVTTGFYIDKQPYIGSLFKSQNLSTWTADQFEDIKFNLYRAKFVTNTTYNCVLQNKPIADMKLSENPLFFTDNSTIVTVLHTNHGMNGTQNYVRLSGVKSSAQATTLLSAITETATSISLSSIVGDDWFNSNNTTISSQNPGYLIIDNEIISYSSITNNVVTVLGRGQLGTVQAPHTTNSIVRCYMLNGVILSDINKVSRIINVIDLDRYQIAVTTKANDTTNSGGVEIWASRNIPFETINTNINSLNPSSTQVNMKCTTYDGNKLFTVNSFRRIENESIENKATHTFNTSRVVLSNQNKNIYFPENSSSFSMNVSLSTSKDNVSPIIYVDGSSIRTASNRVKKVLNSSGNMEYSEELTPVSGTNSAYVCRKVTLQNPSTSIKVLFDAVRTTGFSTEYSEIKVFAKIKYDGTSANFDSLNYIEIPAISYPTSNTNYDYRAFDFELKNLAEFKEFSIKIVMFSSDQTNVPLIKNFRAIALAV